MSNRVVVVGGFTTGKRLLDPVADAICKRYGFADAEVFKFTDVIENTARLQRKLRGESVCPVSAGIIAVAKCTGMERTVAFNAPEPTYVNLLVGNAAIKSANLWETVATGPHRKGAASVIASNVVQAARHPLAHFRQIEPVSRFSTASQLDMMELAGVRTARVDTACDEFFGPYAVSPWDGKSVVLPGCHDQILIDPAGFVAQLPEEIMST